MSERELPLRASLEQYRNQARDLARDWNQGSADAVARVRRHHPRFHKLPPEAHPAPLKRTEAQLVIAREHGFESWPKFAAHLEMLALIGSSGALDDPVGAFIQVACVPRHAGHGSGTLEHAEAILARYPQVAESNIHIAAILANETAVRRFLARDSHSATAKGGPYRWDALTHLCFSRYLRIDQARSEAFLRVATALLDAGASAKTGWFETIDHPNPRPTFESAIYGAAGIARHAGLTRLLLAHSVDPNDEETPYHVPEGYDNTITRILLESGKLNQNSLTCMLVRKADWHDEPGLRLVLDHGADPNLATRWGDTALHHALRRDNSLAAIGALLDAGADPSVKATRDGRHAASLAAHRGRGDVLALLRERGIDLALDGVDELIAACAEGDREAIGRVTAREPAALRQLQAEGGSLLAGFAGNGNSEGIRCLIELGVAAGALYTEGDPYFEIARNSTALHVAAWRARHSAVKELIARGAPVNALDAKGRTALALAVKACVDSYWKAGRSPESIAALLAAGASAAGIRIPTGYPEADELLCAHTGS